MQIITDNSSVFHFWANQTQDHASNQKRSVSFEGTKLYSYSLLIANIVNPETVLIHISDNSVTTNRHINQACYSVNHKTIIICPTIDPLYKSEHKENLEYFKTEIKGHLLKSERARSGHSKQWNFDQAETMIKEHNDYLKLFKIRRKALNINDYDLSKIVELNKKEKLLIAKKKRSEKLKIIKINNAKILLWKKGNNIHLSYNLPVFLRVDHDNDRIETSKGAYIPISFTAILWRKVRDCIKNKVTYKPDHNHSFKVGLYTLDAIQKNGDIMIGCHSIAFNELSAIAKQLNYKGV
ncbi:MAG: hypothetical protein DRG09_04785 [Epsilonproteobacteria bacterium]|nr:MAG: hypothetical protein DRG09_04785 [Campylobacterota bacterium]